MEFSESKKNRKLLICNNFRSVRETGLEIVGMQFRLFLVAPGAFIFNGSMFSTLPLHSHTFPVSEGLLRDLGVLILSVHLSIVLNLPHQSVRHIQFVQIFHIFP